MKPQDPGALFEQARPRLRGLAYRMLGSMADAEDAVQDTFVKWHGADHAAIDTPDAWLTTTCTRRCIDMLRAAHRTRIDYVGPWLPEPIVEGLVEDPAEAMDLASSLSTAFLLMLERLSPAERAAYLLREVFDYDYDAVATILGRRAEACRKLVSRAKAHIAAEEARFTPTPDEQDRLLEAFLGAIRSGSEDRLKSVLADDAQLWTDGGGKVAAAKRVIDGANGIAEFLRWVWERGWSRQQIEIVRVNGGPGLMLREDGRIATVVSFSAATPERIGRIFVVRNPDKLPQATSGD